MIGARVKIVVVSLGAEGAMACIDGRPVRVSGFDVGHSIDTTGAGDLFVAAWAWGESVGMDVDDALKWAALYAALSVRVPTGRGRRDPARRVHRGRLAARAAGAAGARRARGLRRGGSEIARRALAMALVAIATAVGGCGGDRDPAPAAARTPSAPRRAPRSRAAALRPACACASSAGSARPPSELSGLVRSSDGGFWAHNDSGDAPRILALANDGALRREVAVAGAEHVDWEDIAIRGRTLYIGDIGDNLAQRPEIAVYRMPETSTVAEKITLRYPDGPHDAEALLVDPRDGTIVIVTKNFTGPAGVYVGRGLRRARHA